MKNPNCDNDKCVSETSEVRVLPTGGDGNAILCRACFNHEIRFRIERNRELSKDCQFKLPAWESLKVYPEQEEPIRIEDHPRNGIKPDWKTDRDQIYFNAWDNRDVVIRFAGGCVVCGRRAYHPLAEDGRPFDPDPRGIFTEKHAAAHLVASEYSMSGPDVVMCFECSNTRDKYEQGLRIARGRWKEQVIA